LVEHPVNRGLGAARNTAIDFARGEYCIILDADNAIYPSCLDALVVELDDDPDLAFAYPILELFGHDEHFLRRSRGYLTNFIPWIPERLPIYNIIDALALIRTSVLRELDGYAVDRRLYGFEDWDLWSRMAEQGLAGGHVARVLARYRSSPGSMVSLSELSVTRAREALTERSPNLFASAH
jgi:glycosyltransferase involved in cell wall biosynthesis